MTVDQDLTLLGVSPMWRVLDAHHKKKIITEINPLKVTNKGVVLSWNPKKPHSKKDTQIRAEILILL